MPARFLGFVCLLFLLAAATVRPGFASEPRVALVIGNSNYGPEIGRLLNPVNDAKLLAGTLQDLGFAVDLVLDADQKTMKRAIKSFGAKLEAAGKEATGLFYYAGHGVQVDGTNYLLPVGAEIAREADVEIESIAADDVMTQMQSAGNAVNLVFLDACRNNPLAKASRSATRGLARLDAPRGSFVGYSTAPGDVAADGDGANSPYALALAEELKKPGISIEEAHRNVRARVLAASGNKQTPWDSSSLTGPVILAEKPAEAAPAPQPAAAPAPQPQVQQQAAIDKEALFWESIKDSKDPGEYEAYLQQYPNGSFAPLAKAKLSRMAAAPATQLSPAPEAGQAVTEDAGAGGMRFVVSADIKEKFDRYVRNCESRKNQPCYIAISHDGNAIALARADQSWPPSFDSAPKKALQDCGGPTACTLVMEKGKLRPGVVVSSQTGTVAPAAARPSPAPAAGPAVTEDAAAGGMRFAVSTEIKEKFDQYIRNCESRKNQPCYIAISHDGNAIGLARADQSWPQSFDVAPKKALQDCGGPTACTLVMEKGKLRPGVVVSSQTGTASPAAAQPQTDSGQPAQPETGDPAGAATSTAFAVGEVYDFAGDADGFKYRGELRVLTVNAEGELEGEIDIRVTKPSGGGYTVRQDFRLQQQDGQVEIRCFRPRAIEGSFSKYSSDHFYLTRQAPGVYKGTNQDRSGSSGQVVLTLRAV